MIKIINNNNNKLYLLRVAHISNNWKTDGPHKYFQNKKDDKLKIKNTETDSEMCNDYMKNWDMRYTKILKSKALDQVQQLKQENWKIKNLDDKMVQFLKTVHKMFKNGFFWSLLSVLSWNNFKLQKTSSEKHFHTRNIYTSVNFQSWDSVNRLSNIPPWNSCAPG